MNVQTASDTLKTPTLLIFLYIPTPTTTPSTAKRRVGETKKQSASSTYAQPVRVAVVDNDELVVCCCIPNYSRGNNGGILNCLRVLQFMVNKRTYKPVTCQK